MGDLPGTDAPLFHGGKPWLQSNPKAKQHVVSEIQMTWCTIHMYVLFPIFFLDTWWVTASLEVENISAM